ncbi:ROK family transcriptional regulator [Neobacillus rhizophilus]|uniref:ROK family transcriptional regulator n=1 Tax=Neobacillus rhizophilus TaxID=2833579 RepID=A0A942U3S0_9BACI|nr:ROK family transcriptional regulator [Neobacillus rhizophilus]MBS4212317.1 ROK family transcriptional regulator [Neobacillus rhizophilus]
MITGDAAYIKKINRSLIIKEIVKAGMISRADISKVTDLTRATISAQVADLLDEGLIIETQLEHFSVGRKPIMLSLNSKAGYALGIDLDYGQISFTLSDLLGHPATSTIIKINTKDYAEILLILVEQIKKFKAEYTESLYGIVGIVIAIHGLVGKDEVVHFVPRLGWEDIHLKTDLENEIDIDVYLENNANLSSFAERVFFHHETDNLLCATLYSGIGMGMMMKDDFFRGHDGYAGEIGHMIVVPEGRPCNCGNKGCWEKYSSESSVFEYLSEKRQMKNLTYEDIQKWLDEGDQEVHELLEQLLYYLSIGLNNMINIYNPDVLVLDSELLRMYPDALDKIKQNLHSSICHYRELSISSIGKKSCVLGACALAIKHFLSVPMLNLPFEQQDNETVS